MSEAPDVAVVRADTDAEEATGAVAVDWQAPSWDDVVEAHSGDRKSVV